MLRLSRSPPPSWPNDGAASAISRASAAIARTGFLLRMDVNSGRLRAPRAGATLRLGDLLPRHAERNLRTIDRGIGNTSGSGQVKPFVCLHEVSRRAIAGTVHERQAGVRLGNALRCRRSVQAECLASVSVDTGALVVQER